MTMLTPIKQKRVSDQVFEQIRELIYRGTLGPGSKLMTEREMAAAMGVSRTSVRDAIKRLAAAGLVVQKQGRGTFVLSRDPAETFLFNDSAASGTPSVKDLLEVRMGLECYAASLAAQRADSDDISAMDKSLADLEAAFASGRSGTGADVSFHMAVALAAKNPFHTVIINSFSNFLFHGNKALLHQVYDETENTGRILEQHGSILRQIKNRNPERAFEAMKAHILFLQAFVNRHLPSLG